MRCPFCKFVDSKVIDSRSSSEGRIVRRRRECLECSRRFTTKEHVEETPLMIVKSDGRRQPYDQEKLRQSLILACKKRPSPTSKLDEIVMKIEADLRDRSQEEIATRAIGELVMSYLRKLDDVAYVRFASVYRNFQDPKEFMSELRELNK